MVILPKAIYRFDVIPIKISKAFFSFYRIATNNFKIYMETLKTRNNKINFEKAEQS